MTTTRQNYSVSCPIYSFKYSDKEVVLTDGKGLLSTQLQQDIHTLAPCSHVEADSHMILHVSHAAQYGHHQIVVVLAVFVINQLPVRCELCLVFVTSKHFCYLSTHWMSRTRDFIHPSSVPCFDRHRALLDMEKKAAWSPWKSLLELTHEPLMLVNGPKEISDDAMIIIEKFVIFLFDRTSTYTIQEGTFLTRQNILPT